MKSAEQWRERRIGPPGPAGSTQLPVRVALACLAATGLACGSVEGERVAEAAPAERPPVGAVPERVPFAGVELASLRAPIAATGSVEARRISEIAAEVPGTLVEVSVDLGDWVEAGAPLFRVDPRPYEAALAESQAALRLADAEYRNAASEERRAQELVERNVTSQQSFEALRTRAEVARSRVAQMRARAERAERDVERTIVRAPYAGSVIERRAHEGALASGAPVIVLQESGALEAILNVPEASLVPVQLGDPVELFAEGLAEPLALSITRVSDRVQPDTRTYEVRAALPEPAVKAGSYVRAEIRPARREPRPVIPSGALRSLDGRSFAFRLAGDRVERVRLRVGISQRERIEVLAGLAEGDRVAVGEAVVRLVDGARVEPLEAAKPSTGEAP